MTFYQKVKKALGEHGPITYARLAEEMGWDPEATKRALFSLHSRGKARAEGSLLMVETVDWSLVNGRARPRR